MPRDNNKIDSIAVSEITRITNEQVLLQPDFNTCDKTPFFDGYIWFYKSLKQKNDNYDGRIPVQIKGHQVAKFSKSTCKFSKIKKADLEAYKKESGILFFLVQISNDSNDTKIFWKQLLPYDIDIQLKKIKQNKTSIELHCLEGNDLTLVCQNFIRDREKQKHGKNKILSEIKGIEGFSLSFTPGLIGNKSESLHDYIISKKPLYFYAKVQNDIEFPIGNFVEDNFRLVFSSEEEVFVDDKSYGKGYYSGQMNADGYYYQFGKSWRFLQNGQAKFSADGSLAERIRDVDFLLRVIKGGQIRIGNREFLPNLNIHTEQNALSHQYIEEGLEILQKTQSVLDFLGGSLPINIKDFDENDWDLIYVLSEHIVERQKCPSFFKEDTICFLRLAKYSFLVLLRHEELVNVFSRVFCENYLGIVTTNDGTRTKMSPYYCLDADTIVKSSNFNGKMVMESIRMHPYSSSVGGEYTNLLLEAIKALDVSPSNKHIAEFSKDLADYLLENEDVSIYRLNKMQIQKRFAPLENNDTDWLLAERNKQEDPKLLCGIAILLDDMALFDEHFAKLPQIQQEEFRKYPIMKLLDRDEENQDKS